MHIFSLITEGYVDLQSLSSDTSESKNITRFRRILGWEVQGDYHMKTKTYPEIGFLRLRDIIGGKNNPGIIPVSRSSWYKWIAVGRTPNAGEVAGKVSKYRKF